LPGFFEDFGGGATHARIVTRIASI
jgi:hypothetical protein